MCGKNNALLASPRCEMPWEATGFRLKAEKVRKKKQNTYKEECSCAGQPAPIMKLGENVYLDRPSFFCLAVESSAIESYDEQ